MGTLLMGFLFCAEFCVDVDGLVTTDINGGGGGGGGGCAEDSEAAFAGPAGGGGPTLLPDVPFASFLGVPLSSCFCCCCCRGSFGLTTSSFLASADDAASDEDGVEAVAIDGRVAGGTGPSVVSMSTICWRSGSAAGGGGGGGGGGGATGLKASYRSGSFFNSVIMRLTKVLLFANGGELGLMRRAGIAWANR